jgi:hypothetical protein
MCWNAEVSLQSFLIGVGGIIVASFTGLSLPFILFYATIVCMQLIEYVVWKYGGDVDVNYYASLAASSLLALQPLASLLTLSSPSPLVGGYVILGSLYFLLRSLLDPRQSRDLYQMNPGVDGHHEFKWLQTDGWTRMGLVIYFVFLLLPLFITRQYELLFVVGVTLGVSLYSYGSQRTWGSMWCWIVNWMVVALCGRAVLGF